MTGKTLWYRSAAIAGIAITGAFLLMEGPGSPEAVVLPGASEVVPEGRAATPSGDPAADGIKVHGHWTIEVREPDGRVVTRREFENALHEEGEELLAMVLFRNWKVGLWQVHLTGPSGSEPCIDGNGDAAECVLIEEQDLRGSQDNLSNTLELSRLPPLTELVLSGRAWAQRDGTISSVATRIMMCDVRTTFGSVCDLISTNILTSTSIAPVSVLQDQSILVTVRLSFS